MMQRYEDLKAVTKEEILDMLRNEEGNIIVQVVFPFGEKEEKNAEGEEHE